MGKRKQEKKRGIGKEVIAENVSSGEKEMPGAKKRGQQKAKERWEPCKHHWADSKPFQRSRESRKLKKAGPLFSGGLPI